MGLQFGDFARGVTESLSEGFRETQARNQERMNASIEYMLGSGTQQYLKDKEKLDEYTERVNWLRTTGVGDTDERVSVLAALPEDEWTYLQEGARKSFNLGKQVEEFNRERFGGVMGTQDGPIDYNKVLDTYNQSLVGTANIAGNLSSDDQNAVTQNLSGSSLRKYFQAAGIVPMTDEDIRERAMQGALAIDPRLEPYLRRGRVPPEFDDGPPTDPYVPPSVGMPNLVNAISGTSWRVWQNANAAQATKLAVGSGTIGPDGIFRFDEGDAADRPENNNFALNIRAALSNIVTKINMVPDAIKENRQIEIYNVTDTLYPLAILDAFRTHLEGSSSQNINQITRDQLAKTRATSEEINSILRGREALAAGSQVVDLNTKEGVIITQAMLLGDDPFAEPTNLGINIAPGTKSILQNYLNLIISGDIPIRDNDQVDHITLNDMTNFFADETIDWNQGAASTKWNSRRPFASIQAWKNQQGLSRPPPMEDEEDSAPPSRPLNPSEQAALEAPPAETPQGSEASDFDQHVATALAESIATRERLTASGVFERPEVARLRSLYEQALREGDPAQILMTKTNLDEVMSAGPIPVPATVPAAISTSG